VAYGAVTRNLVKRVSALEAELDLWRRPVVLMLQANAAYRGKSLSRDEYVNELEEAMTMMMNSQLSIEELRNSDQR